MKTLTLIIALCFMGCGKSSDTKAASQALAAPADTVTPTPAAPVVAPIAPLYTVKNYKIIIFKTTNRDANSIFDCDEEVSELNSSNILIDRASASGSYTGVPSTQFIIQQDAIGVRFTFSNLVLENYTYDVYIDNVFQSRHTVNNQPGTLEVVLGIM